MKSYLTAAVDYVNAEPGLHPAYEKTGADALARFHRQRGDEVFFLTGTDDNATKNEQAAKAAGIDTRTFVDRNAAAFKRLCATWNISYDRFIRTIDPDHIAGVQESVRRWIANDDVYLTTYEGLYCTSCEAFYEEDELVNGRCQFHPDNPDAIQRVKEENFFFRLSKYEKALRELYERNPGFTVPEYRRNEVIAWFERGLRDVSVSRGRSLKWGIPWPGRPDHTVYVWGDDAARYLVLREAPFEKDSPISPELLNARFNADLANGLGNLVSRTLAMVDQYCGSRVPDPGSPGESERTVRDAAERALRDHDAAASELRFADALAAIFSLVDAANKHYQRTQPWQLAKSPTDRAALETALYAGVETVRLIAYLLYPYTPAVADRITAQLGVPAASTSRGSDVARWGVLRKGSPVSVGAPLFPPLG